MAGRLFKPLGGSQTQGVTCLRASWTFDASDGSVPAGDRQQEGWFIGGLYNDGSSTANQAFYLGRFFQQPYAASALTPHYDQNDFYNDILGIEITYESDSDPVAGERMTFELTGNYVDALLDGGTFAPVFAVKHISLDDGTGAAIEDLYGTTIHMVVWLKNSSN